MEGTSTKRKKRVNGDWCAVFGCSNNRRSENNVIKDHVGLLKWHSPRNDFDAKRWEKSLNRGGDFRVKVKKTKVCSNHFSAGYYNPDCSVPTLFMKGYDEKQKKCRKSPKKRILLSPTSKFELDDYTDTGDMEYEDSSECTGIIITEPISDHEYAISANGSRETAFEILGNEKENSEMKCLEGEIKRLEGEIRHLKEELKCRKRLSYSDIKDDKNVKMMTGIHSRALFDWLLKRFRHKVPNLTYHRGTGSKKKTIKNKKPGPPHFLEPADEFLLVLMKIRMGLTHSDLAFRFNVSKTTISCIISTWIPFLSRELQIFVTRVSFEQNLRYYPDCFRAFGNRVTSILDCTEGQIERPTNARAQSQTYSSYKSRNTWKKAIGITPAGTVNFISKAYGGCASDRYIVETSGYLDTLNSGEKVMVDKGFNIADLLLPKHCELVIPPFVRSSISGKFNKRLTLKTSRIAKARIHVERAIARVKDFRILQLPIPLSMKDLIDDIFVIIAAITNLGPPLVPLK